ncbi:hypothetical protein P7K49_024451, partial [Saguinus oedipus]
MMIDTSGPVYKADSSHYMPPAADVLENLAPGYRAWSNPSREPLSHELVKWYLLETCSAHAQLQVVVESLLLKGQMVQIVMVDAGSRHRGHTLQQMPGLTAPGSVELMLLALLEQSRGASVHSVCAVSFLPGPPSSAGTCPSALMEP